MRTEQLEPVSEYLPRGDVVGCVVVVSDYKLLNLGHASALRKAGYVVYTAVTCTDVPRIYVRYSVGQVDLVVFASLVHGWHHQEAEERPEEIPPATDIRWHTRNILQVIETVSSKQQLPPRVLIATDLIEYDCYQVSGDALALAGVEFDTYSATNPPSIVRYLQSSELRAG
ncbi:MAG TPA: hypothetical protein DEP45_00595 [Armatimonadetes bacterium]|nr:hypothetical protein [Armatimonadota bacterium]